LLQHRERQGAPPMAPALLLLRPLLRLLMLRLLMLRLLLMLARLPRPQLHSVEQAPHAYRRAAKAYRYPTRATTPAAWPSIARA
jgi:hypothetical protein